MIGWDFNIDLNFDLDFDLDKTLLKKKDVKLSFIEFAKKVHNKNNGFYDLADFQLEMAEWRLNNKEDVSMILATRGIGKSDIITCLTSLYLIYNNPLQSLIIITDKATKGVRLLKYIKSIIVTNKPFFSKIFDDEKLLNSSLTTKQNKRKEPSIFIGSLGETLRGIHPDYAVFDDILTRETAWSVTTREAVFEKYEEVKKLTKNILIIGNVCHQLDLYSKLRYLPIAKYEIFHNDNRIPEFLKPNLDKERAEGVSEANIQANYFGILLPDVSIPFYDLKVVNIDSLENIDINSITCYYDFSHGANDSNALTIAFIYQFKCYLLGFSKVCRWSDFIRDTVPILKKMGINKVYYERNITGWEAQDIFKESGIYSVGAITTLNKRLKINRLYPFVNDIFLIHNGDVMNKDYIEEFKAYNPRDSNSKDDAPDSAVMCLMEMNFIYEKITY